MHFPKFRWFKPSVTTANLNIYMRVFILRMKPICLPFIFADKFSTLTTGKYWAVGIDTNCDIIPWGKAVIPLKVLWRIMNTIGEGNGTPLQYSCWKIPWAEEPGRVQSMGSWRVDTTERLHFHFSLSCVGEGNGTPLQCSCLENPRDGEPGRLPSMGSHRVGHDWSDLAAAAAAWIPWMVMKD